MLSVLFLIVFFPVAAGAAFPSMSADSWYTANDSNTSGTASVLTTQTAIGYDPAHNKLWDWNGHPPGGGLTQPDDLMSFDISSATWSDVRAADSTRPPAS
ncbi:MAG TPA: hypothetical protein VEF34_18525 [Syntrophobacteraceae bacterium]|nr:hypothetical protein [Syntrophobacteraceae bacterium]